MFDDLAKSWRLLTAAVLFPFMIGLMVLSATPSLVTLGSNANSSAAGSFDAIGEMRHALARERAALAALEREQSRLRQEVIQRRQLHGEGQLSQELVAQAERELIEALRRTHAARHSVVEMDIAINEAVLGQKVDRMPFLPANNYRETNDVARFSGSFKWSLKEASRIERYFSQSFGRRLPVTAMGQSETHNRLRFDHRNSMDVALHPDSAEGKALIEHLRKNEIPFIAFRSASPGVSTGPHIHIGRPSGRLGH
jgi:hypothetical protein